MEEFLFKGVSIFLRVFSVAPEPDCGITQPSLKWPFIMFLPPQAHRPNNDNPSSSSWAIGKVGI